MDARQIVTQMWAHAQAEREESDRLREQAARLMAERQAECERYMAQAGQQRDKLLAQADEHFETNTWWCNKAVATAEEFGVPSTALPSADVLVASAQSATETAIDAPEVTP